MLRVRNIFLYIYIIHKHREREADVQSHFLAIPGRKATAWQLRRSEGRRIALGTKNEGDANVMQCIPW